MLQESMEDTLIIAVSQSGTTTDTNRTVDLVRQRGAHVLAILNRRNSDLAFKSDGVMFTSDGRDIEMSVASTKAFYSQVTAGALLALYLAWRTNQMSASAVHQGLKELLALPEKMERVLELNREVARAAREFGLKKRYWAVVGSGSNQIAAHEIRIKLSELCYKSMSCDFIEDKKHIDLSSEPLMLVCASGLNEANLSDSVKEVAIFKAHSSIPIVVASRGADRFRPYAAAVFEVPDVPEHLSPVMNTIIGHLFGYHAARAIDDQAVALRRVRQTLLELMPQLETGSRLTLGSGSYLEMRQQLSNLLNTLQTEQFNSSLEVHTATRLALTCQKLLLELSGLVGKDEEESPYEVAQRFQQVLTSAINELSRPIDAIKHQAKTVTVGISRPTPTLKGAIGKALDELQIDPTLILWRNLSYLMAADPLIGKVNGSIQYTITHLDSDGEPTQRSKIRKDMAHGAASSLRSRTDEDPTLRGSKWLALRNNTVQIGVGQQDGRHIAIIPLRGSKPREARILLLHIEYNEAATLEQRLQLLRNRGQVYDRLKAAVTEVNRQWSDDLLLEVPVSTLFDDSAEHFLVSLPTLNA
jgi:glucosamine--fructose-6-phosphate aminotransferase (isomerizing)